VPLGWFCLTMCMFGLNTIAASCSNGSLASGHYVNHTLGWICSLFTLTAYESWHVQRQKFAVPKSVNPNAVFSHPLSPTTSTPSHHSCSL